MIFNGKLVNYTKYAIGEIVLVVIGILIAIQLNKLNNDSKLKHEKVEHLKALSEDLNKDLIRLDMLINSEPIYDKNGINLAQAVTNSEKALFLTYKEMTASLADSILSIPVNSGQPLINTETSIYEQLKSTGNLFRIDSKELKTKILNYYTRAKREHLYNVSNWDNIDNTYRKCDFLIEINADRMALGSAFDVLKYKWLFDSNGEEMRLYRMYLYQSRSNQAQNLYKMEELKKMVEELLEDIGKEINKNNG